ncbi:MAG TPA: hypothetical protein VFI69_00310 [Candidatus Limnocylindrales bacterium]|nr:hypothetical protein [Candidatus Limnocylindrales bacterium]
MDDHRSPDPVHANGTNPAAALDSIDPIASDPADDPSTREESAMRAPQTPTFLSELAHAMQAAADRERERIAAVVAEDASAHVDKVRSRAEIETQELRRLAEEDVARIEEWSASEIERIRNEAAQKTADRRASLDEYLKQHDAIIEAEIEGVDGAVRQYGLTLEQFFAGLSDSSDPSEIVRRAEQLPAPPDLDTVRASARVDAVARFAGPGEADSPTAVGDAEAADMDAPVDRATEMVADGSADGSPADAATVAPEGTSESDQQPDAVAQEASAVEAGTAEATASQADDSDAARSVGVMDPSAAVVPGWPTEEQDHLAIGQTTDHTSAAVRLLRSVAPWTAPVHAGDQAKPSDQE